MKKQNKTKILQCRTTVIFGQEFNLTARKQGVSPSELMRHVLAAEVERRKIEEISLDGCIKDQVHEG